MLQDQIIAEIKQIPDDKLAEIYDLIHYQADNLPGTGFRP